MKGERGFYHSEPVNEGINNVFPWVSCSKQSLFRSVVDVFVLCIGSSRVCDE